jgi:hypothetical protein
MSQGYLHGDAAIIFFWRWENAPSAERFFTFFQVGIDKVVIFKVFCADIGLTKIAEIISIAHDMKIDLFIVLSELNFNKRQPYGFTLQT